ncbi:MAG: hypothetical protein CVV13_14115 [Gammaproteobacteria bacterium HGW-Gammaproteobacteria-3]|nr:MAG: hypothetical protein CVV13_14115 [Gammaproteobacteria bacterium HGW-Gammaproteobacteria-3]
MTEAMQSQHLGRLLALTDAMLSGARSQSWDEVIDTQKQRGALLGEFFSDDLSLDKDKLAEAIRQIITADKEIMALGGVHKDGLKRQLKNITQGKSAIKAYTSA